MRAAWCVSSRQDRGLILQRDGVLTGAESDFPGSCFGAAVELSMGQAGLVQHTLEQAWIELIEVHIHRDQA